MNCVDCNNMNMIMDSRSSVSIPGGDTIFIVEDYKCPICGRLEKKTIIIECVKRGHKE